MPMAATLEIPQMLQLQEGMMNGLSVVGVEACARGGEWGEGEAARLSTSQKPRPFVIARSLDASTRVTRHRSSPATIAPRFMRTPMNTSSCRRSKRIGLTVNKTRR